MNITELLIPSHDENISENKTKSKKSLTKKIKKTNKPVDVMENTKPEKKEKISETQIVTPINELDELLEVPIFGVESTDRWWLQRLKKVNPAAYQNLIHGD